jgi:hypothetical protein
MTGQSIMTFSSGQALQGSRAWHLIMDARVKLAHGVAACGGLSACLVRVMQILISTILHNRIFRAF